jgi:hypothetical protein
MSAENFPPISLIKCLYTTSSYINPLRFSNICYEVYKERYGEDLEYKGTSYTTNLKVIKLVEEIGLEVCSGNHYKDLAIQLVPEKLIDYIEVIFDKGIKIVSINYDKAFANILHTEKSTYEKFEYNNTQQLWDIYRQYYQIAHIKKKMDEIIDELTTKDYVKVYDKKIFTIKNKGIKE